MTSPKLKIAIVGGGVGGLSLAVALKSNPDIEIHIFEKSGDFVPMAGAGMSVWPRTVSIFKKWGIAGGFKDVVTQSPVTNLAFELRHANQSTPTRPFFSWKLPGGLHSFHRAHLLDLLADALPTNTHIHFNAEFASYSRNSPSTNGTGGVTLHLADGKSMPFDLLIACDGLWSSTRQQMYSELRASGGSKFASNNGDEEGTPNPDPHWTGTVVFRALIQHSQLEKLNRQHNALRAPQMYCGKGLRILVYVMNKRQHLNFVAFFSKPSQEGGSYEASWRWQPPDKLKKSFLEDTFKDWEPEVKQLITLIPDKVGLPGLMRQPIFALKPLPKYVHGRVVLLGDAAHATSPGWGFGAGASIEDANVLGALLSKSNVNRKTLDSALEVYDKVRVAEGCRVICGSRLTGFLFEFNGPMGEDLAGCAQMVEKQSAWVSKKDPEEDVETACAMLKC